MTYEERLRIFRTNVGFALPNDVEENLINSDFSQCLLLQSIIFHTKEDFSSIA
jgi:hypothetical protein